MLAVAWDLLGSKSAAAAYAGSRFILFLVTLSFKFSYGHGESCNGVSWSVSARARADWRCCCRHSFVSRGKSEHCELISSCWCHLSLRSAVLTGELGQRVQRASQTSKFSAKPSSWWQRNYHGKNRAYWRPIKQRMLSFFNPIVVLSSYTS